MDTVSSNIPLFFTRDSVKPAEMQLTVENDTIMTFGKSINLIGTKSGYYTVSVTIPKRLIKDKSNIT